MNINKAFILRCVADENLLIPTGAAAAHVQGLVTLNETGALLWEALAKGGDREALADALTAEYVVDRATALSDVDEFLAKLAKTGCLEA